MTNIKQKIQEIKLARMGPEYRFVAEIFSGLVPRYLRKRPGCTYYLNNDIPMFLHMEDGNYFWCHYELFWIILEEHVRYKMYNSYDYYNQNSIKEMKRIISHFTLAHFNLSDLIISMAHNEVTNGWANSQLIMRKPW